MKSLAENEKDRVKEFRSLAETFCSLVENRDQYSQKQFFIESAKVMSRLNAVALDLPDIESESESVLESQMTNEEWKYLYKSLGRYFGENDHYIQMFDPTEIKDEKPTDSSLSDDFADIYRDLKRGLILEKTEPIQEIIWDWRFNFKVHWGNHLTRALVVIHQVLFKDMDFL